MSDSTKQTPLCGLAGTKHRLMIDNGAGASVFPVGYDKRATADDTVNGVHLVTATGQSVKANSGKRSAFRVPSGQTLTVRYNESPETKFPIVSVAEATQKGNWFIFGPGVQMMAAGNAAGHKLAATMREQGAVELTNTKASTGSTARTHLKGKGRTR